MSDSAFRQSTPGPQGATGFTGPTGSAGPTGFTGPSGPTGIYNYVKTLSQTSTGPTPTPDSTYDVYELSAATGNVTFGVPSGTPTNGQQMLIRISSSNAATARTLAWSTATGGYAGALAPAALPSTTIVAKGTNVWLVYCANPAPAKWRVLNAVTGA